MLHRTCLTHGSSFAPSWRTRVQVPMIARPGTGTAQVGGDSGSKLQEPASGSAKHRATRRRKYPAPVPQGDPPQRGNSE